MSNKTQLQTNNSTLASLTDRVSAAKSIAAALPEAGENNIPEVEQATPSITVSSSGLITASATQGAGMVSAGTKSATKQLSTQSAKTVTPSTSSQTAVASGKYTTGTITVAASPSTYIQPSGTKTITENGTYDVKSYASASVNVSGGSKITCGTLTPASDTSSVTFQHNLGVVPKVVIFQVYPSFSASNMYMLNVSYNENRSGNKWSIICSSSTSVVSVTNSYFIGSIDANNVTIEFSTTCTDKKFRPVKHEWIAIA